MAKDTRCGIGIANWEWQGCGAFPFINVVHGPTNTFGPDMQYGRQDGHKLRWFMSVMNEYGYPNNTSSFNNPYGDNGWGIMPCPVSRHYPEQKFILSWQGTGAFSIYSPVGFNQITHLSGNATSTPAASSGAATRNFAGKNPKWQIKFNPSTAGQHNVWWSYPGRHVYNNMHSLYFCMSKHEAAHLAGKIWNPDLVEHYKNVNPRWLRWMPQYIPDDPGEGMPFSCGQKEEVLCWYSNSQYPRHIYADLITTTNGYQWHCPKPSGMPNAIENGEMIWGITEGAMVLGHGPITLNVGDRGLKTVLIGEKSFIPFTEKYNAPWNPSLIVPADDVSYFAQLGRFWNGSSWTTGPAIYTFVYDAYFDAYLVRKGCPTGSGLPLSARIKLCNEVGCGLWYNFPNYTAAPDAQRLAKFIAQNLDDGVQALFEYGNEAWGGVNWSNIYVDALRKKVLHTSDGTSGMAAKVAELMPAAVAGWAEAGRDREELLCSVMWQAVNDGAHGCLWIAEGKSLIRTSHAHLAGVARPHIDCIGLAPYVPTDEYPQWWGGLPWGQNLLDKSDQYAEGDANQKEHVLFWMYEMLIANFPPERWRNDWFGLARWTTPGTDGSYHSWEAACASQDGYRTGLQRPPLEFLCYEGGITIVPPWSSTLESALGKQKAARYSTQISRMYSAFAQSMYMKRLAYDYCKQMAEFPHGGSQCRYSDHSTGGWDEASQEMVINNGFAYVWDSIYAPWISQEYHGYKDWNNGEPQPILPSMK